MIVVFCEFLRKITKIKNLIIPRIFKTERNPAYVQQIVPGSCPSDA